MYNSKRFGTLYDLTCFLNENKIKFTEIIGIYRIPIDLCAGEYGLLYYVEEEEKSEDNYDIIINEDGTAIRRPRMY